MARIAYVNGSYRQFHDALVHVEDRGLQFGDSVYEVVYLHKGRLIDCEAHLARLEHSLRELGMDIPMAPAAIKVVMKELVRKNKLNTGLIYMQVTRGSAKRDFHFPHNNPQNVILTARRVPPFDPNATLTGMKVMTLPDIRWARRDIKTTQLLAASIAKRNAQNAGFADAWQVDTDGMITEGTSNNAWIVNAEGNLQTRPASHAILNGITRRAILAMAEAEGLKVIEKAFSVEEAYNAKEAFISSASACVKPVTQIDNHIIAKGDVGPMCQKIAAMYADFLEKAD